MLLATLGVALGVPAPAGQQHQLHESTVSVGSHLCPVNAKTPAGILYKHMSTPAV